MGDLLNLNDLEYSSLKVSMTKYIVPRYNAMNIRYRVV